MSSVLLDLTADRLPAEARVLVESRPLPPDVVFHPVLTGMASGLWTWVGLPAAALLVVGGVVHLVTRIRVGAHLAGAGGFLLMVLLAVPLVFFARQARDTDAATRAGQATAGLYLAPEALFVLSADGRAAWLPRPAVTGARVFARRDGSRSTHVIVTWRVDDTSGEYTLPVDVSVPDPTLAAAISAWAGR